MTTGHRYDQCDWTCTVDCGHCKGNGQPQRPHRAVPGRSVGGVVVTSTAGTDDAATRSRAARWFMAAHRRRRENRPGSYRPDTGLSVWCAWEEAEGQMALSIARDLALGRDGKYLADDLAVFRLIGERVSASQTRYAAKWRVQHGEAKS